MAIFTRIKLPIAGPICTDRPQIINEITAARTPPISDLCWQGERPSIAHLSARDILNLYERNWQLRGVMADLSDQEMTFIRRIAAEHRSWLVNEV